MSIWTPELDQELMAASPSIRGWARSKGISENAAIARRNRIKGVIFESDRLRGHRPPKETAELRAKRLLREAEVLRRADARIASGAHRDDAIAYARDAGVRFGAIGDHFGISRQRASAIVGAA
jgi:hypothetical protein